MTTSDFSDTYGNNVSPEQLICRNEIGEKLLAGFYNNSQLKLYFKDKSKKVIFSNSIELTEGKIKATEITNIWQNKKLCKFTLDDIDSISIRKMWITWTAPYYNIDSLQNQHRNKMDSLEREYATKDRLMLELISKNNLRSDTIRILENACYHLEMNNGKEFRYGIIYKITTDSITISTVFEPGRTLQDIKEFLFSYSLTDIAKLNLLKSVGIGAKSVSASEYEIYTKNAPKGLSYAPCWYSVSRINGRLIFYRLLLTETGFKGVQFEQGKYYWFEG
jgi:hypothetical protein